MKHIHLYKNYYIGIFDPYNICLCREKTKKNGEKKIESFKYYPNIESLISRFFDVIEKEITAESLNEFCKMKLDAMEAIQKILENKKSEILTMLKEWK